MAGIPASTMARLAKLDARCDFRFDRCVRAERENAGRAFRYWRVEISGRGQLSAVAARRRPGFGQADESSPRIVAEDRVLAVALLKAVEQAEKQRWGS